MKSGPCRSGNRAVARGNRHLPAVGRRAEGVNTPGRRRPLAATLSMQVPVNRLHLVSVNHDGVARIKLRPRFQLDVDSGSSDWTWNPPSTDRRQSRNSIGPPPATTNSNRPLTRNASRRPASRTTPERAPPARRRSLPRRQKRTRTDASGTAPRVCYLDGRMDGCGLTCRAKAVARRCARRGASSVPGR